MILAMDLINVGTLLTHCSFISAKLTDATVATHQSNYSTILSLRAKSEALDIQIKSTLQSLADVRKELIAAKPLTPSSKNARQVDYQELLSYAQRIARFTAPPTRKQQMPAAIKPEDVNQESTTNGLAAVKTEPPPTPAPDAASSTDIQMLDAQQALKSHLDPTAEEGRGVAALSEAVKAWLEPSKSGITFTPWPSDDTIRRGALARIQVALEEGKDPTTMDIAAEVVAERKEAEALARGEVVQDAQMKQEEEKQMAEAQMREAAAVMRLPQTSQAKQETNAGLFDFDLYNPDEE